METTTDRLTVTVPEAAEMLGLSRSFTYELAASGRLPTIRFGRKLVVPRKALDELLADVTHPLSGTGIGNEGAK